jgi:hypothetical protein
LIPFKERREKMNYQVYYRKNPTFMLDENLVIADVRDNQKFASVRHFINSTAFEKFNRYAKNVDDVWYQMQGEVYSPNGEWNDTLRFKGVDHTSMSVGDVICAFGWGFPIYLQCAPIGWKPIFEVRKPNLKGI